MLKTAAFGVVAAAGTRTAGPLAQGSIERLTSTSDVFIPPRGRSFNTFSFDFPEPSVAFEGLRFGFLVFTRENAYGLDADAMRVEPSGDGLAVRCERFVWAGGQERAPGSLTAVLQRRSGAVEWDIVAEMDQPIKAVTTVLRGVPRGRISAAGAAPFDPRDDEVLFGYPFGAGDLFGENTARSLGTPLVLVQSDERDVFHLAAREDRVRAKRFFFQPGEHGYRVEAVHEVEGWLNQRRVTVPTWRAGRAGGIEAPAAEHYAHLERAFRLVPVESRGDAPAWMRDIALVLSIHGMHYTGYVFNDYARTLEILRWSAERFPPGRTLVFLPAWDGRYYWDYPNYRPAERLGGETGFRRLCAEGSRLGFHVMPMFGMNAANRRQPVFARLQDAASERVDGEQFDITWVDWDNDRHQEGWLAYMNLGVDSWRRWLAGRIASVIETYGVEGYFLDISGGWMNNTRADMHEGTRRLVGDLRARYPQVLACGEFLYDALVELLPMFHVYSPRSARYARFFSHLSHPAPGRGSSGVHESGFGRFDPESLSLAEGTIPTLTVVDDTFEAHRDVMEAVLARARERAGIRS
ncbi:MAG: hypothetical protein ACHQU1_09590 [Gemmatimonadales bacterium]